MTEGAVIYNLMGHRDRIGLLEIDMVREERHEFTAVITDHPIETGGQVQDHIYLQPVRVTISGTVSDTPVTILGGVLNGVLGRIPIIGGALTGARAERGRSLTAKRELLLIHDSKTPVQLITQYGIYDRMASESMIFARDQGTGLAVDFTATFKQLTFAESSFGFAIPGLGDAAQLLTDGGRVNGRNPVDVISDAASLAYRIFIGGV